MGNITFVYVNSLNTLLLLSNNCLFLYVLNSTYIYTYVCHYVVCVQGEVLGITRFGLAKMKESVLMLASVSLQHIDTQHTDTQNSETH